jgi:hypothetical protein
MAAASAAEASSGSNYVDDEEPGELLQWSYGEQPQQQQQQQEQQEQQDHLSHLAQQSTEEPSAAAARKQQKLGHAGVRKDNTASARRRPQPAAAATTASAAAADQPSAGDVRPHRCSGQGPGANQQQQQQQQQRQPYGQSVRAADADQYAAAQQRVRQLLVSADMSNPAAAAAALPDTVNDIVTALQILATAPKPPGLVAAKQYDAAVQQLAAAVVSKFKRLLLRQQQQHPDSRSISSSDAVPQPAEAAGQPTAAAAAAAAAAEIDTQSSLATALAGVPATKLAAAAFSLGVLRHYDTELVPALEKGSLQLMLSSSSSSTGAPGGAHAKAGNWQQQQQQQQGFRPSLFNVNQLGQLAQGFVYLDHEPSPAWQAAFLQTCRRQMQHMKALQLASIAAFLLRYRLHSNSSSSSSISEALKTSSTLAHLSSTSWLLNGGSGAATTIAAAGVSNPSAAAIQQPAAAAAAAAAAAGPSKGDVTWQLYSGWSEAYLSAAAQQAAALKPQHMVPVLQAAAGLYQQHLQLLDAGYFKQQQQQQQQQPADRGPVTALSNKHRRVLAAARLFGDLPVTMPAASAAAAAHGGSRRSSSEAMWLLPLLLSFQQQLPDLKMQHLAAVLPPLAQLTVLPWPDSVAKLLLLQLRLLLPGASGTDAVTAAAAAACLAPRGAVAADIDLHYALLQRLHAVMSTLSPGGLAAAVQTLAVMKVRPYRAWVFELCARLRVEARSMSALEVLAVLEGLAAVKVQLDPEVLHMLVLGVQRGLGVMSRDDLCRTLAALRRMYPRVLPGRTVAQLVEELERRAALLELQEVSVR